MKLVRKVLRRLRPYTNRPSHPNVRRSIIDNFSHVDPSARISGSRLVGKVQVGRRCVLDDCYIRGNSLVSIGLRSSLTGPITIIADQAKVSIGKFSSLAPHVAIWESGHRIRRITSYFIMGEMFGEDSDHDLCTKGGVLIGNDVWIGTKAVILSGVAIGDGAVIGAGSVVTKHVPPYSIVAGVPAAVVKSRFSESICRRLEQLRWWDWDDERIKRNRSLFEADLTIEMLDRVV
jgi:acetyltransferase-like isoleucine patch superfamily enzyme